MEFEVYSICSWNLAVEPCIDEKSTTAAKLLACLIFSIDLLPANPRRSMMKGSFVGGYKEEEKSGPADNGDSRSSDEDDDVEDDDDDDNGDDYDDDGGIKGDGRNDDGVENHERGESRTGNVGGNEEDDDDEDDDEEDDDDDDDEDDEETEDVNDESEDDDEEENEDEEEEEDEGTVTEDKKKSEDNCVRAATVQGEQQKAKNQSHGDQRSQLTDKRKSEVEPPTPDLPSKRLKK